MRDTFFVVNHMANIIPQMRKRMQITRTEFHHSKK